MKNLGKNLEIFCKPLFYKERTRVQFPPPPPCSIYSRSYKSITYKSIFKPLGGEYTLVVPKTLEKNLENER